MNYQIVKADNGKFSLYVNGALIAQYTRKSDALRGFTRYQTRMADEDKQVTVSNEKQTAKPQTLTGKARSRGLGVRMKALLATAAASAALLLPVGASALTMPKAVYDANDLLTGDVRLACETILCLSSGERPHECADPLRRYFSIRFKKPHKTITARKNFLKLCPSSNEPGMPALVDALAKGAGRCDAGELNRVMRSTYRERVCEQRPRFSREDEPLCRVVEKSYIRNAKPSYCSAYFNHEWTNIGNKVRYIGTEKHGGYWADVR